MKRFNKFIAVLCSATMILGSTITAFAEAPTSTAGTGNMLTYQYDTVVVPTAIKVAFNPQGLTFTLKDGDTPVTTTAQIVSLNYGIASKSSSDKKVVVKFAANYVLTGESSDAVFVATEAGATNEATTDDGGAKTGEHKIYLYVAPATAQPTINDGSDTAFAVTGDVGAKQDNATAANLADVNMTAATAGLATFAKAATSPKNDGFANIGFALDKASYGLKSTIGFDTTQSDLADGMELTEFGTTGITGFTFKGKMNTNTDWTKANISAITITPTYEITEKGTESAVASTHGVVTLSAAADTAEPDAPTVTPVVADAAPSIETTSYAATADTPIDVTVSLGSGDLKATGIASVTYKNKSGEVKTVAAGTGYTFADSKITLSADTVNAFVNSSNTTREFTVTFNDSASTVKTFTLTK